jgi:TRAP-type C4-dicarboxylate transport system substrate-binding protein
MALAGLGGSASVAAADNVELRMATLAPTGSRWEKTLSDGGTQIATKTSDRVTVKYFADGGQGDEVDYIRKINAGQLDGAAVTTTGLAMIDPSIKVLELPMMFETVEEMDYVRKKMWKHFQKKFEKKGFQLGEAGDVGWIFFLSKNKVESLADLKNQKVWRWGDDDVVKEMYKQLGLTGVPLGVPEVEGNLTGGKINACYGPPLAAMTLGWTPPKVKYITSMPMAYGIGATVIKLDAIKNVSKDDLKAIDKIQKSVAKKLKKAVRKDNDASLKQMKRKGVKEVTVSEDMVKEFAKAAEATWKALAGKLYTQDELDDVLKYRDEYRAKAAK